MSSTETLETTPNPESTPDAEVGHEGHAHEGHTHDHEGHDHTHHQHGPTLNPDCTREVEVEVPAAEVSKAFAKVVKQYQRAARIPGFRAGKVPDTLIRKRFADSIRQDVLESLLPEHFRAAIAAHELKPVSQPQVTEIKLEDGQPIHCKAAFEVIPPFSIDGYQDVKVEKPATELTEEEYQAELERLRDSRATMEPVTEDRALVDGDWAQISFRGDFQNPAAEGETPAAAEPITGDDVVLEVGGKNTLDSFNQALRGAKPGQQLKFEVSYPDDFNEKRLAGKTVAYDIEVKAIKKRNLPELNDEFAKELGEYQTIDEFTGKFREHMADDKHRRLEAEAKDKLLESLIARFDFPIPESLVQAQIDARLDRGLRALAQQGMRAEDMRKLDFNRLRAAQRDSAVAEVKGSILLDRIAETEKIEVPDAEVDHELQLAALQAREPIESMRARLTEDGSLVRIREQLRREKTGTLLYERLAS